MYFPKIYVPGDEDKMKEEQKTNQNKMRIRRNPITSHTSLKNPPLFLNMTSWVWVS